MLNTPNANRTHIGIFGKMNSGKSSLLNAITNQNISIVSNFKGTTTDSVLKSMELIPYGPVLFIDTAGLNDSGEVGNLRVKKALDELKRVNFALFIMDGKDIDDSFYKEQLLNYKKYNIPHLLIINKKDLLSEEEIKYLANKYPEALIVSSNNSEDILNLKEHLINKLTIEESEPSLLGGLLPYNSLIVLVVPIDSEAPKGRLILPQVQILRDALDNGIQSIVVRDTELEEVLNKFKNIDLIITDSQAFKKVNEIVADRYPLTSFSILFARQKGDLKTFIEGIKAINNLKDGDYILISESCSHNTSHEDIGRVKIPNLLKKYTLKQINFEYSMGKDFPDDLNKYALIIHCGSCMLNKKIMMNRIAEVKKNNVPITNYGVTLAYLTGILEKSTKIFN
ncbi:[FeFe] hydrogenase H-cluster maturation GTPase HydF [Cetobacterium sp. SF1]|uniref:[FeFe] hydrogenase H-cluster maturation GTPase HydF n=1 Tax=Cetobacterium sp. SF1 TaxID=3417654 RepID=UPI003CFA052E